MSEVKKKSVNKSVIADVNGSNIKIKDVVKEKAKPTKIIVKFDDTTESVIELLEGMEIVELSMPPGVFVELPAEVVKEKLTAHSITKYFVAKNEYEASQREAERKKDDPNRGRVEVMKKGISLGRGGIVSKMEFNDKEKAWAKKNGKHLAILEDYQMDNAIESGYTRLPESVCPNGEIREFIPKARREETLFKVAVDQDAFDAYVLKNGKESKRMVKRFEKDSKNDGQDVKVQQGRERTPVMKNE